MDSKKAALITIAVVGGIGVLAVSCSDSGKPAHVAAHDAADEKIESEPHPQALALEQSHETTLPQAEAHAGMESEHVQSEEHAVEKHKVHWAYDGEGAPHLWGELSAEYSDCAVGKEQSPIDISTVTITDLSDIAFDYQPTPLDINNNGHSIQVNYAPGSSIIVAGKQYQLLQFHFHSPSEHTVGGKAYDMVAHLVHKADDGQLGVIGVLFKAGEMMNNTIAKLWLNMPENAGETIKVTDMLVNAADLLPRDLTYFNYSGSLTTPPCSEGVNWMVMVTPNNISEAQVKQFTDLFPSSVRPVQPLNGRAVIVSN